jgi:hypothetical protein
MAATVETAQTVKEVAERKYKYGFVTEIECRIGCSSGG